MDATRELDVVRDFARGLVKQIRREKITGYRLWKKSTVQQTNVHRLIRVGEGREEPYAISLPTAAALAAALDTTIDSLVRLGRTSRVRD